MAKKGSSSGKISGGGRQRNNVNHENKRQAYFAKKREEGRAYVYTKNPYDPKTETEKYNAERAERIEKAKSSRTHYARMTSLFAKLDNYLNAQKMSMKNAERTVRKVSKA